MDEVAESVGRAVILGRYVEATPVEMAHENRTVFMLHR